MGKTLFFLTSQFPYGSGETFIETEINYLAEAFEKIILVSDDFGSQSKRPVPSNVEVFRFDNKIVGIEKAKAIRFLFNKHFRSEVFKWLKKYDLKINEITIKICINTLYKAYKKNHFLQSLINKEIDLNNHIFLYSYWCDENAVSLALLKIKNPSLKTFSRAHGWDVYFYRHKPAYLPFRNLIFSNLDKIFFISENGFKYTSEILKFKMVNKFNISRLGIQKNISTKNFIPDDKIHILSCSNVIGLKRIDIIIDALSKLNHLKRIRWTHIGSGDLLEGIKEYAKKTLAEKNNIEFSFTGQQPNSFVNDFYLNNDVKLLINVSQFEGVPVSIMEAFSYGIPAIATNVGGNSEIVSDNYNGILLSEDPTPEEVSKALEKMIMSDKDAYKTMSDNAFKTWGENYNAEKNYKNFVKEILK